MQAHDDELDTVWCYGMYQGERYVAVIFPCCAEVFEYDLPDCVRCEGDVVTNVFGVDWQAQRNWRRLREDEFAVELERRETLMRDAYHAST